MKVPEKDMKEMIELGYTEQEIKELYPSWKSANEQFRRLRKVARNWIPRAEQNKAEGAIP